MLVPLTATTTTTANHALLDLELKAREAGAHHAEDKLFVPHALRHTCATRLAKQNVPIKSIQAWLGHKTISVTMRYVQLFGGALDDAAAALEGFED